MFGLGELQIQFILYIAIAVVRTAFDMVMWKGFVILLSRNKSFADKITNSKFNIYTLAHVIAVSISIIVSYVANKYLVFGSDDETNQVFEISSFLAVSLFSLAISTVIIQFLTANKQILKLSTIHPLLSKHWPFCARLAALGVTIITNFVGYRFISFGG
jgi:putative flippase GtrA